MHHDSLLNSQLCQYIMAKQNVNVNYFIHHASFSHTQTNKSLCIYVNCLDSPMLRGPNTHANYISILHPTKITQISNRHAN